MFCTKCGSKLKDNAKYCSQCGNKVSAPRGLSAKPMPDARNPRNTRKRVPIIMMVVVILLALLTVVISGFLSSPKTRTVYLLTETIIHDEDKPAGIPDMRAIFEYDELGNLKMETHYYTTYSYSSASGLSDVENCVWVKKYTYNDNGYRNACRTYLNNEFNASWTVVCDENGRIIKEEDQNSDSPYFATYSYDMNGNILQQRERYKLDGIEIDHREEYTYNKDGEPLSNERWEGGRLVTTRKYEYDSTGKLTSIRDVFYHSDGKTTDSYGKAVYNENGILEQVVFYDDDQNASIVYKYDDVGNLVEVNYYYTDGKLKSTTKRRYQAFEIPVD